MAKKRKHKKDKVFNDRPRKVFRKYVGASEVAFSVCFIGLVMLMGLWFAMRKDDFDPGERDISIDVLIAQSVEDHLYEPPLKRWVDPSVVTAGLRVAVDLEPYPSSIIGEGWTLDSRLQEFNSENLYEKINGQADQYILFGFETLHFLAITNAAEGLDINLELYNMGTFANALGIFAAQRSEGTQVLQKDNAFYYPTLAGAFGIVGSYYFKLSGSENSEFIREKALDFVAEFSRSVRGDVQIPSSLTLLSQGLGLDFSAIEYQREDVFQYAFAKDFWFGKVPKEKGGRFFVHEADSEEAAAGLFEEILEEHLFDLSLVTREGNDVILQHDFLKNFSTLNQNGNYVFGIDGADSRESAVQSLASFQEILLEHAQKVYGNSEK